jgi:ADP-heptose:LPS heptosyltransferase
MPARHAHCCRQPHPVSPYRATLTAADRVVVFRALKLGDMLCAVPALRALRRAFPPARITLVGLPVARDIAARLPHYVDEFIEFPGHPALPERVASPATVDGFVAAMRSRGFGLALQLHGDGAVTTPLVAAFGARRTAGFVPASSRAADPVWFPPYPDGGHEVDRVLALLLHLGIPAAGRRLELPLDARDRAALAAAAGTLPRPYACIHPGAAWSSRRWPAERFAAVGDGLAARGLHVVVTGGAEERALADAVVQRMRAPAVDLAGRTSLGALAALLAGATLLVCNDTGVSHVSAALRTPSVVVVTGSDADRWAPLDRARHAVVREPVACSPCPYRDCPIDHRCAHAVTPAAVLAAAERVLDRAGRRAA